MERSNNLKSTHSQPNRNDEQILETKDLTKDFGGLRAVDEVTFRLRTGSIHCLIGPNGAGKSTFFKLLVGQLKPTRGQIFYQGGDITEFEPYERANLGMSLKFQRVRVYPKLSVKANIRLPAQRHVRGSELKSRIDELLALADLDEHRHQPAGELAHGQQQWLEIAMAMAIEPELLLLDEPTAGMTIEETEDTGRLIQSLAARDVSVIVVEHDVAFVRQIAERVTVLHNGKVLAQGSVEDIEKNQKVQQVYLGEEYDT